MTNIYIIAIVYCYNKTPIKKYLNFKPFNCGFCLSFWVTIAFNINLDYLCIVGTAAINAIAYNLVEKLIDGLNRKITLWSMK